MASPVREAAKPVEAICTSSFVVVGPLASPSASVRAGGCDTNPTKLEKIQQIWYFYGMFEGFETFLMIVGLKSKL